MDKRDRVLVAIDLSEGSDEALREGVALAASSARPMAVVHVLPPLEPIRMLFPQAHLTDALGVADLMRTAERAVRERLARVVGPREVEIFIEEGLDYERIVKRAEKWRADIVVVGSHGQSGLGHVFGGVADRIVRYAHCTVLVARGSRGGGCVVAATDLSPPSLAAVLEAAAEARRRGLRLKVVHAVSFLELEARYLFRRASIRATRDVDLDAIARELDEVIARLGVDATCQILDGPPAAAIIRDAMATDAELVVVGTRGGSGLARVVLGSVAEKVVRGARCSVLVVRETSKATGSEPAPE